MMTEVLKRLKEPIVHNYVPIRFADVCDIVKPERYLHQVAQTLDDLGVKWCFAFGSALGLYRDKGFIPHDTDIDVMILADEVDAGGLLKAFPMLTLIRTVTVCGVYHQIAFQSDDDFIIDLCLFYRDGAFWKSYCEGGHWKDAMDVIGDFTMAETEFGRFPVPERIEDYLVTRYGDDWHVPKWGNNACSIKES